MTKIVSLIFAITLGVMVMTGCAVYTPLQATNAEVPPAESKKGVASCRSFFGLVKIGKCTIAEAIEDGKITQVQSVDREYFNILFYKSSTIIVRGK